MPRNYIKTTLIARGLNSEYIAQQYLTGKSCSAIAKELNCSETSIRYRLKKLNVKIRPSTEYNRIPKPHRHQNLINQQFGQLTVKCLDDNKTRKGKIYWQTLCSCGNYYTTTPSSLIAGKTFRCKECANKARKYSLNKFYENKTTKQTIPCAQCGKMVKKDRCEIKNYSNNFCSHSCVSIYKNAHQKTGTKVSKLEKWLAIQLTQLYPNLEFHFNRKDAINSELDIYIPSLKLAFELNGIFHYEPIYGAEQLAKIQNNDKRKFQACIENSIELYIIDVSKQKHVNDITCQVFLDIIVKIIMR